MKALLNWLSATWDAVRTSLWLVPGLLFAAGAGLAFTMVGVDAGIGPGDLGNRWWLTSGGGQDAANLLSTLLTAIITMASMAFSVTVVALSLAANSYGPRMIRLFRADMHTQLALGIFVMTIVYLLIVLQSIRGEMSQAEVPHLSAFLGVLLSLVCVLALLSFIQGVARSIVADDLVRRVRREFDGAIADLPDREARAQDWQLPAQFADQAAHLRLPREGYVQSVDYDDIVAWAARNGCVVELQFRPGDFVVQGDRKVRVFPPPADPERARREIERFIVSGQNRTPTQDLEFSVRHLVEIAVRALSPGINDPFTAIAVVDRLRGGLARLAQKSLPDEAMFDEAGQLRIVRRTNCYAGVVAAALNQIRQAGASKPAVLIHMLGSLGELAEHIRTVGQKDALEHQAGLILADGERELANEGDLADLRQAHRQAIDSLARARIHQSARPGIAPAS